MQYLARQNPVGVRASSWQLLWLLTSAICQQGHSQNVLSSCSTEAIACYTNGDCKVCVEQLLDLADSSSVSFITTDCSALFKDACNALDKDECDIDNEYLVDFAQCVAEEEFGCTGFTSCTAAIENMAAAITVPKGTSAPTATTLSTAPPATVAPTISAEVTAPPATIAPTLVAWDAKSVVPNPAAKGAKSMAPTEASSLETGTASESNAGVKVSSITTFATSVALLLGCTLLVASFKEKAHGL